MIKSWWTWLIIVRHLKSSKNHRIFFLREKTSASGINFSVYKEKDRNCNTPRRRYVVRSRTRTSRKFTEWLFGLLACRMQNTTNGTKDLHSKHLHQLIETQINNRDPSVHKKAKLGLWANRISPPYWGQDDGRSCSSFSIRPSESDPQRFHG